MCCVIDWRVVFICSAQLRCEWVPLTWNWYIPQEILANCTRHYGVISLKTDIFTATAAGVPVPLTNVLLQISTSFRARHDVPFSMSFYVSRRFSQAFTRSTMKLTPNSNVAFPYAFITDATDRTKTWHWGNTNSKSAQNTSHNKPSSKLPSFYTKRFNNLTTAA